MKIVHIIPTFNERENIARMIDRIFAISRQYSNWQSTVLVVDDFSPDQTADIVKDYQKKYSRLYLIQKKKEGLGKALIKGYEYAITELKADVVIPNDADFQWDPDDFPKLVQKIEEGYDAVVASRHIKGAKVIGWNWFRKLNHDVSNYLLAWWVAGVRDVKDHAGNFKAIRVKNVLDRVKLSKMTNAGFSFQLHILYELSKTGAKFTEIPVIFQERKYGKSKIGFNRYYLRDVFEYLKSSLLIRIDRSPIFFKYVVVGGVGFLIQTLLSKLLIGVNIHPGIAVTIGAEGAIISNFVSNNRWTFSSRKIAANKIIFKFIHFNIASLGAILIQGIVVGLGTMLFGESSWFVLMILSITFFVIPYSYSVYNIFIWKK